MKSSRPLTGGSGPRGRALWDLLPGHVPAGRSAGAPPGTALPAKGRSRLTTGTTGSSTPSAPPQRPPHPEGRLLSCPQLLGQRGVGERLRQGEQSDPRLRGPQAEGEGRIAVVPPGPAPGLVRLKAGVPTASHPKQLQGRRGEGSGPRPAVQSCSLPSRLAHRHAGKQRVLGTVLHTLGANLDLPATLPHPSRRATLTSPP